jgi:hypothetical protein
VQALDIAVDVFFWIDLALCFRTGARPPPCFAAYQHSY